GGAAGRSGARERAGRHGVLAKGSGGGEGGLAGGVHGGAGHSPHGQRRWRPEAGDGAAGGAGGGRKRSCHRAADHGSGGPGGCGRGDCCWYWRPECDPVTVATMTPDIKICGLTTRESVLATVGAGATHVGFVFLPKSARNISLEAAQALRGALPFKVKAVA